MREDNMETSNSPTKNDTQAGGRRRRWPMVPGDVRFFLPKQGSSPERPELGEEIPTEKEVLVKAFQKGEVFYTLVTWEAVPDAEGDEARIVKKAFKRE